MGKDMDEIWIAGCGIGRTGKAGKIWKERDLDGTAKRRSGS